MATTFIDKARISVKAFGYRGLLGRRTEEKTGGFQRDFLKILAGAAGENSQLSFFHSAFPPGPMPLQTSEKPPAGPDGLPFYTTTF
mgnify:CR=1 FL=1